MESIQPKQAADGNSNRRLADGTSGTRKRLVKRLVFEKPTPIRFSERNGVFAISLVYPHRRRMAPGEELSLNPRILALKTLYGITL